MRRNKLNFPAIYCDNFARRTHARRNAQTLLVGGVYLEFARAAPLLLATLDDGWLEILGGNCKRHIMYNYYVSVATERRQRAIDV